MVQDEIEVRERLCAQAEEIAHLQEALADAHAQVAYHRERARTLAEQVKLLTSGPQGDPAKRAWMKWWW
ncbi:MAG TPA: hypothetical protein V6D05_05500 [Stenomitos sp.]